MIKKTITYTDYNGLERTEDFYFNLTKSELIKTEMTTDGGYGELLSRIGKAKNAPEIMRQFERIIKLSYGERSDDGRRFIKSQEISDAFAQTPAYDELFYELCTDVDSASKFVNGILPEDMKKKDSEVIDFARNQLGK